MLTQQQKAERHTGIGGSDIHHIFNLEPYGCRRWLWYDKTGVEPDYPLYVSDIMERGNYLEPVIAQKYSEENPHHKLVNGNLKPHPDYEWAKGNIDRRILKDKRGPGVWEAKCNGREMFYENKNNGMGESNILQLHYYLWRDNRTWGAFSFLWPDGWQHVSFEQERDDELIDSIVKGCDVFWRLVQNGPAPNRLGPEDKRCQNCNYRYQCQGIALLNSVKEVDEDIPVKAEIDELETELLELEDIKSQADTRIKALNEKIKAIIGDEQLCRSSNYKWHYKAQVSERLNSKQFKQDHPDLWKEYSYKSVSRPLRKYELKG